MSEQKDERDQQTMGRYEVYMYGQDVVMVNCHLGNVRLLRPAEALMLLEWLCRHKDDLSKTANAQVGLAQASGVG
jgi:hypothetical protein